MEDYRRSSPGVQLPEAFREVGEILAVLDDDELVRALTQPNPRSGPRRGRPPYPIRALWRAYVYSFIKNLPSTNELVRQLEERPDLRIFCGLRQTPDRSTFNGFIRRMRKYTHLIDAMFAKLTDELKAHLPDLGKDVAVDSTTVTSNSRPYRKDDDGNVIRHSSDREASWTAKNSPRAKKGGKDWYWGYKLHMLADINYGLPLTSYTTTASRNDHLEFRGPIEKAREFSPWFKPRAVVADKGYDSIANHLYLWRDGILPIIHLRKPSHDDFHKGIYTDEGVPTCIGQVAMRYVRTDPKKGHFYRCVGCWLKNSRKGGLHYCNSEFWQDPNEDIRLFGAIRRAGPEFKGYYAKRQAIERVFKSLKESRRLNRHYFRGMAHVALHGAMSTLTFQATVLANVRAGRIEEMCWMVRKLDKKPKRKPKKKAA